METLRTSLLNASTPEARSSAAAEFAKAVELNNLETSGILKTLDELLSGAPVAKEGGTLLFKALVDKFEQSAVPFLYPKLLQVIDLAGDKKSAELRDSAEAAAKAFAKSMTAFAVPLVFDQVLDMSEKSTKWQVKVLCLKLLSNFVNNAPEQVSSRLVTIVPVVSAMMWDSKKQVQKQAAKALKKLCSAINNKDVAPFIPKLINAIAKPEEVEECVHELAATTFVQTVDAAALSITVPVLDRGFRERKVAVKRKCAVITENMAKLVENPADVAPFMPVLEPHLARAKEEVADPECRTRCAAAHQELLNISNRAEKVAVEKAEYEKVKEDVKSIVSKNGPADAADPQGLVVDYLAKIIQGLSIAEVDDDDWKEELLPGLKVFGMDENAAVTLKFKCCGGVESKETFEEEAGEDAAEKLCDCRFSLAYGSRILLNNARLYLKRGMRYGIVAAKSAGKTTLLRSISNGQLEGFPVNTLKTVFVEHDIQASQARMNTIEFTLDTVNDQGVSREDVVKMLTEVGFTDFMQNSPITSLSGGWKMKLALARAMLRKADILLLDEPTNHLDVINVQWVVDYLTGPTCSHVTSLIVSHDTKFLDNVATHIIHFDALKLNNYAGNLSKFVERFPHAKAYYDLSASSLKFKFPPPGPLDGVKSKGRAILSMTDVEFRWPGQPQAQLKNINIKVSMASRVACVGANGAGKSTMIKLLTGEVKPEKGTVYKHPNCNFAYVAQHAFHHIEQHLSKTPTEYIMWRYSGGEDKEALQKSTVKITDEEMKKMKTPILVSYEDEEGKKQKEKRVVEKILTRRRQGKIYEYEVKWENKSQDLNTWYPRHELEEMGFTKLLDEVDRRKAAQENAFARVLSKANVEQHFENVGLDRELASHNRISSLSGGQKVKVVLGACTWSQPHLIILDEPTNYLDREALGALAGAINEYEGGIVLITHNQEFANATTRETWVVANNTCDIKGDADWTAYAAEAIELGLDYKEDRHDAMGNKIEVKQTPASVKLKDKKRMMKELKKRLKEDPDCRLSEFEEACCTEWGLFE